MRPNKKRAVVGILCGVLGLCLLLLVLAAREFMFVLSLPALTFKPLSSILRLLCIELTATSLLAVWVFVLTRHRGIWTQVLDADESIRVRLGFPAKCGRAFFESRRFTILISVLLGLFILAMVATVAAYIYLKGT